MIMDKKSIPLDDEATIFMKNCREIIENLCKEKNISYEELAKRSHMSLKSVKKILNGENKDSKVVDLAIIADVLGISIIELFDKFQQ